MGRCLVRVAELQRGLLLLTSGGVSLDCWRYFSAGRALQVRGEFLRFMIDITDLSSRRRHDKKNK